MKLRHEPGAPQAAGVIPLSEPCLRGNEWTYVKECLDTGWVSSAGTFVERFQREAAARLGVAHAVAVVNGTAALHLALLVAGVEPDDEVLVPALTFIAPVNTIRYVGAWPVLMDCEPEYWQLDAAKVAEFCRTRCRRVGDRLVDEVTGRRVKAILPVDLLGHPVDMDPVMDVAEEFGLAVIEDATESLGARYRGRPVGNLGHVGCLSFNGNKLITTGGGGMLVTDDAAWAQRAAYLSTQAKDDPLEYVHGAVGYNYRLPNVLAAIGCAQFEQLDACVAAKRRIAQTYVSGLARVPGLTPMREAPWATSTSWLFTVLVDPAAFGMDSRALMARLAEAGIQCRPLWQPMHRSPAHAGAPAWRVEAADALHRCALSLPCSVGLREGDQRRVIEAIVAAGPPASARGTA